MVVRGTARNPAGPGLKSLNAIQMPKKKDIQKREDVGLLVRRFYGKIRADQVLGPIFNSMVTDWEAHLERLTDFWESQLFLKRTYIGNPLAVHQQVDDRMDQGIRPEHFGLWLNLWFATLDELFEGEVAWIAKNRAQKMSTMLYLKIFEHRKK